MNDLSQPVETPSADFAKAGAYLTENALQDAVLAEYLAHGDVEGAELAPINALKGGLRWVSDWGWMRWNGKYWAKVPEPVAIDIVRISLKELFMGAMSQNASPTTNSMFKVLLNKNKATNVAFFLRGLLATDASEFDAYPDLLNCQNGIVNLSTGLSMGHHPRYMLTKITAVGYVPEAEHPDWTQALEAMPADIREYMQTRYGQAATGHPVDDDVLIIQKGGGQNGKSTIMEGITKSLGDYGVVVPEKVLLASPGEHPTELMTLRGARFALIEETPEGHRLPTKRLKDLVGTPTMTARAMRQDFVSWDVSHTIFVDTNYDLQVAETDHGTWRRLQLVNFPYKYVHPSEPLMAPNDRHGVPGLREHIRDNRDGQLEAVLAWVIAGARRWYLNDRAQSATPYIIQADTERWRAEADLILAYAQERLVFTPNVNTPSKELFEDFSDWLRDSGRQVWNDQTFSSRFGTHDLANRNHISKKRINLQESTIMSRRWPSNNSVLSGKVSVWHGVSFARNS
ncbi:DNA primase family protein [Curtobacterium flaccumfaciens]|uniref:DNA primase family protein n=1 Tax=Curtobacterium flaccumfaciens TaxID=2035 RepID=UPI00112BA852|nr:phage/plasmid primase, P4 family [Curtobacterium flaccumfaciens]TPG09386.1 hypothetical protein EAH85_03750 [Curtobacterium flaccumfaciens]